MNDIILENIPFEPDIPTALKKLHLHEGSQDAVDFQHLLTEAQSIANPKALYQLAEFDSKEENGVTIQGVKLISRVLRVNLDSVQLVFPFLATCGIELQEWADSFDDMFTQFWAEAIKELALYSALEALRNHLDQRFKPGKLSAMSPGSLEDWPITEQQSLFRILGDTRRKIGVQLSDSNLMIPTKSVSGIHFPLDESFESCMLCPRVSCINRRAPYDETLYEKKYCPKLN